MTDGQLQQPAGCSANFTVRLRKNDYVSMESVEKICIALGSTLNDIVKFVPEENDAANLIKAGI